SFLSYVVFFLFLGLSSDWVGKPEDYAYSWTFGLLPSLCEGLPRSFPQIDARACIKYAPLPVGAILFFSMSLLPAFLVDNKNDPSI
ncbi:MAG TPA: hypothetical protein VEY08_10870, partial [Chloroflexia bacterium]|nr:hypothetical protein [Chloroflexia bacterium]